MQSRALWLLLLWAVISVQGSVIQFNSTSTALKPPLTENFSMRCSLHDTAPTVSGSGGIIGRKRRDVNGSTPHITGSANLKKQDERRISVTNTSTNADFVTSIAISKDGSRIAVISEHVPLRAVVNSPRFTITGSLTEKSGERGFLQLTWPYPTQADSGSYECDIDAVDLTGGSFNFVQTEQITSEEVGFSDLVDYVQTLAREKDQLEKSMNNEIQSLKQENQGLASQLNKTSTRIFFSAGLVKPGYITFSTGQVLVFNQVWANEGQAYQSGSGVFTCPIAGFYAFSYNIGAYSDNNTAFRLHHNSNYVIEALNESGKGLRSASNEIILKLAVNDTVKIVSRYSSRVFSTSPYLTTTFSGELIKIA